MDGLHQNIFKEFLQDLNDNEIIYYLLRGFEKLPHEPDTDIDLVCNLNQYDDYIKIADKNLEHVKQYASTYPQGTYNAGFAEYANMLYTPYMTPGPEDASLPNGGFRVDSYNCLFFYSPLNNFTKHWTLPFEFNSYVFKNRKKVDYYFTPSAECDVLLLTLRNVLDIQGNGRAKTWKQKHVNRIEKILQDCDKTELLKCFKMVLPDHEKIVNFIYEKKYTNIFNEIIKY
tara:strand:+ start:665 stop:1351 length:687 start_codon:yes stop_codon:yes gene_type:complete